MSKSIVPMPFVCKWSVAHPTTCRFKTREELIIHIDEHIINFYDKPADSVDSFYTCPWEGHLHKHARQRPFKCPVCNERFSSFDTLSQHLITNHNDSFVESDSDGIVNEDKNMEDNAKDKSFEEYVSRWDQHQRKIQDLFNKGMEAIPFLPEKKVDHDLKLEDLSVDNLPESSQEVLSEYEHEVRGMKAFVEYHKGFIGR
ncbi:hypothetical protein RhiirC2_787690 [Rhizophagus irregularis]|uniref:C2H2-type domain-containing protein n=1 Tax=Rhizophagus irregularis TaxID=588596 RepID=A0A2N1MRQ6_9GLOM|nr:hypothetical protein RhiirC2_787690 [Rhizophagus irregularis]